MRSGNPSPTSIAQCKAEMEKRDAAKPRKASKPRTELKEFEHEMSGAARRRRQGDGREVRSVRRDREGKFGRRQRFQGAQTAGCQGLCQTRRHAARRLGRGRPLYLLRRGKDIVSLSVFLLKDQPIEAHEFQVIAPQALLDGGKPVAEIRPTATEAQKQSADSGLAFKDLPSAAAAFDAALAKITAKLGPKPSLRAERSGPTFFPEPRWVASSLRSSQ